MTKLAVREVLNEEARERERRALTFMQVCPAPSGATADDERQLENELDRLLKDLRSKGWHVQCLESDSQLSQDSLPAADSIAIPQRESTNKESDSPVS
jgi:hypothetical protein